MDYVHRTNLIPDPRFRHVDGMKSVGVNVAYVDHENGKRYVRAIWDGKTQDPYLNIASDISNTPGSYRLFFNVFAQGGDASVRVYTRTDGTTSYRQVMLRGVADGQTIRGASDPFDLQAVTIVRIVPPKTAGGMIMITECNLELASTFDQAYPYFDWATMPDPRGGGGIRPSHLAARAVRSQWGLAA